VRWAALIAALAALLAVAGPGSASAATPPVKHVFVLLLENENADSTFGAQSKAPYLAQTLRAQGAFVPNYYATGHLSLDNYISLISGQGPNPYTQADAPLYVDFLPGTMGPDGQAIGQGAVYPASVKTIADQLDAKGLTWAGFMEDMGNSATEPKTCRHPAVGTQDHTQSARKGDQYATRHNPYMYFHSIIDDQAKCDARVVPLERLPAALSSESATPNYTFITPNLCHDGHDEPCVDDQPGGMTSANEFLKAWVPKITGSPAFKKDGLLIITLDEAEQSDTSSCCGEKVGPNTPNNGGPTPGNGGGRVGAVVLSPFVKPGTETKQEYNHYSQLRSFEDLLGLEHLGYAAQDGLKPFGDDLYTNPTGTPVKLKKPSVTIAGVPRHCHSGTFRARLSVTGSGISELVAAVDGKRVKSSARTKFTARVHCASVKVGVHRLTADATGAGGKTHRVFYFRRIH
jgi:hypothetical protein